MDKISDFSILLGTNLSVYSPGERVSGKIKIFAKEKVKISEINLLIRGDSRVYWKKENKKSVLDEIENANETHLNADMRIMESKEKQDIYLEKGKLLLPFSYQLPNDLPSSFEHSNASTRYFLRATISIPGESDMHFSKQFTVVSTLNLNDFSGLKKCFAVNDSKSFGCWPCRTDTVISKFEIYKTGFVSGEGIKFKASIENRANLELNEFKVCLIKKLRIQKETSWMQYSKTVALLKNKKMVQDWESEIFIPPLCPSSNISSKLISISYSLMFTFKASKYSSIVELEIPLIVGSIPFKVRNGRYLHTYEPFPFEYSKLDAIPVLNGEINSNDIKNYKPLYPFFKYI